MNFKLKNIWSITGQLFQILLDWEGFKSLFFNLPSSSLPHIKKQVTIKNYI